MIGLIWIAVICGDFNLMSNIASESCRIMFCESGGINRLLGYTNFIFDVKMKAEWNVNKYIKN